MCCGFCHYFFFFTPEIAILIPVCLLLYIYFSSLYFLFGGAHSLLFVVEYDNSDNSYRLYDFFFFFHNLRQVNLLEISPLSPVWLIQYVPLCFTYFAWAFLHDNSNKKSIDLFWFFSVWHKPQLETIQIPWADRWSTYTQNAECPIHNFFLFQLTSLFYYHY